MVKGSGTANNNGTYKLQSVSGSTLTVAVPPSTTVNCTTSCGTLYLGTPILGFGSSTAPYNDASCFPSGCFGFGEHIKNLGFNCQNLDGCIGWQNLYAQEESGADTFIINNYSFVGVDVHHNAQNFGPILNAEIYTGNPNTNCAEGTTGMYIGDKSTRGLNGWTINDPANSTDPPPPPACAGSIVPIAAVMLDASNTEVRNGHCEGFANCVLMGANNDPSSGLGASGEHVDGIDGPPTGAGTNAVQISGNFPTNSSFQIERIRKHGDTNAIVDNIRSITLADAYVGSYAWDTEGSAVNILTTNGSIRNRFDSGIRTSSVASGVSTASDLNGELFFTGATSSTYTFSTIYTNHPECTIVPLSNPGTKSYWVNYTTSGGFFQLVANFSVAFTGTVSYTCSARN